MNRCGTLPPEQMHECRRKAMDAYSACLKACPRAAAGE
jgi:hypothetical protein